jgi:hypothetical protein
MPRARPTVRRPGQRTFTSRHANPADPGLTAPLATSPCLPETAPVRVGDTQARHTSGEQGIKWIGQRKRFTEAGAALAPLGRT